MHKTCLLITCALNVSHTPTMALKDPQVRLTQTLNALGKWIDCKDEFEIDKIVLIENTNSDLSAFGDFLGRYDDFLEILSFDGQREVSSRGKGYGELNSCEYALKFSRLLPKCTRFMKIGARYFIPNYANVVAHSKINTYIFCTFSARLRRVEGLFFGGSLELLQDMAKNKTMVDERIGFEHENYIALLALSAHVSGKHCTHLIAPPVIEGQSGTSGLIRRSSRRMLYLQQARNIVYSNLLNMK